MNDLTLRRQIQDELEHLPDIDAAAIGVSVENGVVVLTGQVSTPAEKIAAERAVKRITGVRAGAEELEVRSLNVKPEIVSDDIKVLIEQALARNSSLNSDRIRVSVMGDRVKIEGYVHRWFERKAAEQTAWAVAGVKSVENHVLVT